jgi:hypothetical protein
MSEIRCQLLPITSAATPAVPDMQSIVDTAPLMPASPHAQVLATLRQLMPGSAGCVKPSWSGIRCATSASRSLPRSSITSHRIAASLPCSGHSTTGKDSACVATESRPHVRHCPMASHSEYHLPLPPTYPTTPTTPPTHGAHTRAASVGSVSRTAVVCRFAGRAGRGGSHPAAAPLPQAGLPRGNPKSFTPHAEMAPNFCTRETILGGAEL